MLSDGETGPGVIRDQTLFGVHLPKRESLGVIAQPFASLPEKRSVSRTAFPLLPRAPKPLLPAAPELEDRWPTVRPARRP
jgi:hypothetical protein